MSRLAKKPVSVPDGVSVAVTDDAVEVKGPKGALSLKRLFNVGVKVEGQSVFVSQEGGGKQGSANTGTTWSLIQNAALGVHEGFSKVLEVEGVGFRVQAEGKTLVLNIGFSHPVRFSIPDGVDVKTEKNIIIVSGVDKALVGKVAAEIRAFKKPEPYLGKGIRYRGEVIRRKVGKKAATAGATGA